MMTDDKSSSWFNTVALLGSVSASLNTKIRGSEYSSELNKLRQELQILNARKHNLIEDEKDDNRQSVQKKRDAQSLENLRVKEKWKQEVEDAFEKASKSVSVVFAFQELAKEQFQKESIAFCISLASIKEEYLKQKEGINKNVLLNKRTDSRLCRKNASHMGRIRLLELNLQHLY